MTIRIPLLAALLLAASPAMAWDTTGMYVGQGFYLPPLSPPPAVTRPGEEQIAHTPFGPFAILASAAGTNGTLGVFRTTEPAGAQGPSHAHTGEVETFYVLAGTYRFGVGSETMEAPVGTTIVIPRNVVSHYDNVGKDEGHLLVIEVPGGFEQFFADVDLENASTPAEVWALEKKHGITNSSLEHLPKAQ